MAKPLNEIPEILSEVSVRYRRNMLIVSLIMIGLTTIPDIKYEDLSLFGLKPGGNAKQSENVIWTVLAMLFVYQTTSFVVYSTSNYRAWYLADLKPTAFHWLVLFGKIPSDDHPDIKAKTDMGHVVRLVESAGELSINQVIINGSGFNNIARIDIDTRRIYRRKLILFLVIEFGGPLIVSVIAGLILFNRLVNWNVVVSS